MFTYRVLAAMVVMEQLIDATGLHMELARPLSLEYQSMLVLWRNDDIEEHCAIPALLGILEPGQRVIELRWWWSWVGNNVVRLSCDDTYEPVG